MTSASEERVDFAQFAFLLLFTRQQHKLHMVLEAALITRRPRLVMTINALVLPQSQALKQAAQAMETG